MTEEPVPPIEWQQLAGARAAGRLPLDPAPPPRPDAMQEALGCRLLRALSPSLGPRRELAVPPQLGPFESLSISRRGRKKRLGVTWFPAAGTLRGSVLLLHPWVSQGQAYFHRAGRLEALRTAGYQVLTLDFSGFGDSGPVGGFCDRDVSEALAWLTPRAAARPLHLWGVSAGGYWAHLALSRTQEVAGAIFEDVSPHLLEWSHRLAPRGRGFYAIFRYLLPAAYRFLDLRRHTPALATLAATYVSGERDRGVLPRETRELSHLAGADWMVVPGAVHLGSIRVAGEQVITRALETFERAERRWAQR